jgi:hypothetical protein
MNEVEDNWAKKVVDERPMKSARAKVKVDFGFVSFTAVQLFKNNCIIAS